MNTVVQTFLEAGVSLRSWVKSRIIFDTEALFCAREAVLALNQGKPIDGNMLRQAVGQETAFAAMADLVVCVSAGEQQLLENLGGLNNTRILGHNLSLHDASNTFEERYGILFVGPMTENGTPNVDSIDWFLEMAWPFVLDRLGARAKLTLVGDIAPGIRERYQRPNVDILGRVNDLEAVFDASRVAIAPTRFAAGIPEKVHKSVSHGVPMVISPLLRAQIGWEQGTGCISADWRDPEAFADAVVRLHENKGVWTEVRERGMAQVKREFDTEVFRRKLRDICEDAFFG